MSSHHSHPPASLPRRSLFAMSALQRVALALVLIVPLWLLCAWALADLA